MMEAEENAMRSYLAELMKAEDEVRAVCNAVITEREKFTQMKRQWLINQTSAEQSILEDVALIVSQSEERVLNYVKKGAIPFGSV